MVDGASPPEPPLPPGEADLRGALLDERYAVERVLGCGGMAVVYGATDRRFERPVVVKVPRAALLRDPAFRLRFWREIRSQVDLEHPGIARVLDCGEHDQTPFAVIQYLGGGSLAERVEAGGGSQTPDEILRWLPGVAQTLDFMHERGLVHRDVKPGNILFDTEEHVFLSDFGIVKALGSSDGATTMIGVVPGTPRHMAPEQIRGVHMTHAADQYALASTIYEILAGRPAYEDDTPVVVLARKQVHEPSPLRKVAPDVPRSVSDVVMRGLARRPDERFPCCGDLAAAFRAAAETSARRGGRSEGLALPMPKLLFGLMGLMLLGLVLMILRLLLPR